MKVLDRYDNKFAFYSKSYNVVFEWEPNIFNP